jgi:hypothetical protein
MKKVDKCGVCKVEIKDGTLSLQCDLCELWLHVFITDASPVTARKPSASAAAKDKGKEFKCVKMSQAWFDSFDENQGGCAFFCLKCGPAAKKWVKQCRTVDEDVAELKTKLQALAEKVGSRDAAVETMQGRLVDVDRRLAAMERQPAPAPGTAPALMPPVIWPAPPNNVQQPAAHQDFNQREREQREQKKMRLTMFRKPESAGANEEDKVAADLVDVRKYAVEIGIDADSVVSVKRDRPMNGRDMRILKITFKTLPDRLTFLTGFAGKKEELGWPLEIWVRDDYTDLQQAQVISLSTAARALCSDDGVAAAQQRVVTVRGFGLYE